MNKDLSGLEKKLGFIFENKDLLRQALVHRSYLNEDRNFPLDHNERLEFLGDAVLELVVTDYLYKNYPNPEGDLTNWRASLVNSQMLGDLSEDLEVDELLYLSKGESKDKNSKARHQIWANAFEAIIGAIYLEHGYEAADKFIADKLLGRLPEIIEKKLFIDPKSRFQEAAQDALNITPSYKVLEQTGPDHAKEFLVGVFLGSEKIAEGKGTSKHEAQTKAAEKGLEIKEW
jgi:ribonuclease-3